MVGFFIVFHHILFVISARLLSLKAETHDIQRKRGNFNFLSVSAKNIRLLFQKYKALILKYKPYISKYMACIFAFFRPLKHDNLQKHLSSLFIFRFLQVRTPRFRLSFFQKQSFGLRFTLRETGITIPRSFKARVFLRARQQRLHVPESRQLHRHR